jgi:hypothetical protein
MVVRVGAWLWIAELDRMPLCVGGHESEMPRGVVFCFQVQSRGEAGRIIVTVSNPQERIPIKKRQRESAGGRKMRHNQPDDHAVTMQLPRFANN